MAIYRYNHSALIERVDVRTPHVGVAQATLILKDNISADALESLRTQLGAHDLSTMMDVVDGRTALQVRGLPDEKKIVSILHRLGLDQGGTTRETTPDDNKKESFGDNMRRKALFFDGVACDIGNALFFVSGYQRAKHNPGGKWSIYDVSEALIGGAFTIGDVLLTAYGDDRGDEELRAAATGLKTHLDQQALSLQTGDTLGTHGNKDLMHRTQQWLRNHIVQAKCATETAGGAFMMLSAIKPGDFNRGKLAAGALVTAGYFINFMMEKPRGHEVFAGNPPPSTGIVGAIKDNPRVWASGSVSMGNNFLNLWGAFDPKNGMKTRYQRELGDARSAVQLNNTPDNRHKLGIAEAKQHDYMWNVITACCFIVANIMWGLSGIKPQKDDSEEKRKMDDLVLLAANALAKQPVALRDQAIDSTAEYVAKLSHVTLPQDEIAAAIRAKVEGISKSSWVNRTQHAAAANAAQTDIPIGL